MSAFPSLPLAASGKIVGFPPSASALKRRCCLGNTDAKDAKAQKRAKPCVSGQGSLSELSIRAGCMPG